MLAKTHDMNSNSYASLQQYYSRKRCVSRENDEEKDINKKQRNNNDRFTFTKNTRYQQIVSLSESDESQCIRTDSEEQQRNGRIVFQLKTRWMIHRLGLICKQSVSIDDVYDHRLDWFKDFMRQSLDTIRDTVVQACITAISSQSTTPLNSNVTNQDINVNNHRTRLARSEHSLISRKTIDSWQHHQLRKASMVQTNNDLLLLHDQENNNKKQRTHHRARTSPYPMYKNIIRTPVSDARVPWSYEWPQYRPITFTAEEIYINPGADPGMTIIDNKTELNFSFLRFTKIIIIIFIDFSSF
jgi:hypothetical protein